MGMFIAAGVTGGTPKVIGAVLLFVLGLLLMAVMEAISPKFKKKRAEEALLDQFQ